MALFECSSAKTSNCKEALLLCKAFGGSQKRERSKARRLAQLSRFAFCGHFKDRRTYRRRAVACHASKTPDKCLPVSRPVEAKIERLLRLRNSKRQQISNKNKSKVKQQQSAFQQQSKETFRGEKSKSAKKRRQRNAFRELVFCLFQFFMRCFIGALVKMFSFRFVLLSAKQNKTEKSLQQKQKLKSAINSQV